MGEHRPPPPTLQQRLYWPIAVACGAVMLAGTIGAAQAVAPQVTAAELMALTPERPAEPSAHGGPLAPLSIGVVAPETDVPVVPPVVRSSVRDETPSHAQPGAPHQTDTVRASTVTTAPAIATPVGTTTPPTTTAAAATTTPPATTTRTCRWCHHTSPATTTETTTAATTTEATETTSEPIETLISDVLEETGP